MSQQITLRVGLTYVSPEIRAFIERHEADLARNRADAEFLVAQPLDVSPDPEMVRRVAMWALASDNALIEMNQDREGVL